MINWWNTDIGEIERSYLNKAFSEKRFSCGPYVREFEEHIEGEMNVAHAIVVPSGTAALTMSLLALDVGPGDEVIIPDMTWIATAQAASVLGAKVILVDAEGKEPVFDIEELKRNISEKTKVVIPVHFHGRSGDLDGLLALQKNHNFSIVEDACKAMFCKSGNSFLGTRGDFGCFSLGMVSLLSVGYGGFAVTNDDLLADKCRLIRDHGMQRQPEHYLCNGFNFKVSDLLLAIGKGQLERIEEKKEHLLNVYKLYEDGLKESNYVDLLPVEHEKGIIPLCVDLKCVHRQELGEFLLKRDIEISKFHKPVHMANYLGTFNPKSFPNSIRFSEQGFMPPCGPSQSFDNIYKTIELILKFSV